MKLYTVWYESRENDNILPVARNGVPRQKQNEKKKLLK